jgi:hypothetical protein
MTIKMREKPEGSNRKCTNCGKRYRRPYSDLCGTCWYESLFNRTMRDDPEDRDWEWSHCDECGSALGTDGFCHNSWCGASPDVGEDWE